MKKLILNLMFLILLFNISFSATSIDGEISAKEEKIKSKATEIESLQNEINILDEEISTVKSQISDAQLQSYELEIENQKLTSNINSLNLEIDKNSENNADMLSFMQKLSSGNEMVDILFSKDDTSSFQSAYGLNVLIKAMSAQIAATVTKMQEVEDDQKKVQANVALIEKNISDAKLKESQIQGEQNLILEKQNEGYAIADSLNQELVALEEEKQTEIEKINAAQVVSKPPDSSLVSGNSKDWMAAAGIAESDYGFVDYIVSVESGWDYTATNSFSGAYGLCQALPGSKMQSAGSDWQSNPVTQLIWCDGYASSRYGTWESAYDFWSKNHWW